MKFTIPVYIAFLTLLCYSGCDIVKITEEKSAEGPVALCSPPVTGAPTPTFIVNNKIMHQDSVSALKLELIRTVNVLSPDEATKLYGTAGKNGVVLVKTNEQIKN